MNIITLKWLLWTWHLFACSFALFFNFDTEVESLCSRQLLCKICSAALCSLLGRLVLWYFVSLLKWFSFVSCPVLFCLSHGFCSFYTAFFFFSFLFLRSFNNFIFRLCWGFVAAGAFLVAGSGDCSGCSAPASHCGGFSLQSVGSRARRLQSLWCVGSVAVGLGLGCPMCYDPNHFCWFGRHFTTEPPGKVPVFFYVKHFLPLSF